MPRQPTPAANPPHADKVLAACRTLERADPAPTLDQLAAQVGLAPRHFHRVFKAATGLTPKAYAAAHRDARLRAALAAGQGITSAILDAGYSSPSSLYERTGQVLGMTPTRYRAGAPGEDIAFAVGQCSLGAILVASSAGGVCAICLGEDPDTLVRELQARFPRAALRAGDPGFEQVVAQVVGLVEHPARGLGLPLDVRGTVFQRRVWQALQAIAPGSTASYAQVAARIGAPKAVRAVAAACAANTLAVAIPCHRVVRTDGGLSGYRWGVERKRALLEKEAAT